MSKLQTLDRGLIALSAIAERADGLTIAELAEHLEVHRAIIYRIVETLEAHRLVVRGARGRIMLGGQVVALAARFHPQLRNMVLPALEKLAAQTGATAFCSIAEGAFCTAIATASDHTGVIHLGYRDGSRHPLTQGAAGIAILSGRPATRADSDAIRTARSRGYSLTRGELQPGAVGLAVPVRLGARAEASVGIVTLNDLDEAACAPMVMAVADGLTTQFAALE